MGHWCRSCYLLGCLAAAVAVQDLPVVVVAAAHRVDAA